MKLVQAAVYAVLAAAAYLLLLHLGVWWPIAVTVSVVFNMAAFLFTLRLMRTFNRQRH